MELVQGFAGALVGCGRDALGSEVLHETRRCILNGLGTAIGASRTTEVAALVSVGAHVGGSGVAIPGRSETLDLLWAACAIGFAGHFDDFDDTHLETVIHPGAATLGALWAVGSTRELSGFEAVRAMALGIESQLRIGMAMTPSHYDAGWHITGTCGGIGAAVTVGAVEGFDATLVARSIGLAADMTIGHREAFGTPLKPFHAGKAASNGVFAATLAASEWASTADLEVLEGYFHALAEETDLTYLAPSEIGQRWLLLENTYKPFPCGIVAHPAIEAAIALHPEIVSLNPSDIVEVSVLCNPLVPELMGRPTAGTGLEARFCAVHGVAVGLLFGAAGLAQFSDVMSVDPKVVDLRDRTTLVPDRSIPRHSATVIVERSDGVRMPSEVVVAGGSRDRPLTDDQLLAKFVDLVDPILPGRSAAIAQSVWDLGAGSDFADVVASVMS